MEHIANQTNHRTSLSGAEVRLPDSERLLEGFRRIGRTIMARKLDAAIQRFVRQEQYDSARIIVIRIMRDLAEPLGDMDRRIDKLESLETLDPEIARLVSGLRRDRKQILAAIQRLLEITPPAGTVV